MATNFVVKPVATYASVSDTNGGGFVDGYAAYWNNFCKSDGGPLAVNDSIDYGAFGRSSEGVYGYVTSLVAGLELIPSGVICRCVLDHDASGTRMIFHARLSKIDSTQANIIYLPTGDSNDVNLSTLDSAMQNLSATDTLTITYGGALSTVDKAIELSVAGTVVMVTTDSTSQDTYTVTTSNLTVIERVVLKGVYTDGTDVNYNYMLASSVEGNVIPKLNISDKITIEARGVIRGISVASSYTFGILNSNGLVMDVEAVNSNSQGSGILVSNGTATNIRATASFIAIKVTDGTLSYACGVGSTDNSSPIIQLLGGYEFWGIATNLIAVNQAATKASKPGIQVNSTNYSSASLFNSLVVGCKTGIQLKATSSSCTGGIANNIMYNCTNAYDYLTSSYLGVFFVGGNAFSGTRNIPKDVVDLGGDVELSADPFVDSANGDYRLDPDGPDFAKLYDTATGRVLIGATGPELTTGGGTGSGICNLIGSGGLIG